MGAGTGAAPGQAPPDLPSLLLDGRICYIGMPVSPLRLAASPALSFADLLQPRYLPSVSGCTVNKLCLLAVGSRCD